VDVGSKDPDTGFAAVQLLTTLLILGVLAATAFLAFTPSSSKVVAGTTTAACSGVSGCRSAAVREACLLDAKAIETAALIFDAQMSPAIAVERVGPRAGQITFGDPSTYAQGAQAQRLLQQRILRTWPGLQSAGRYALSLSTLRPGDVAIHIPAAAPGPGTDFEFETSTTGCNSL
jgi:hypothetical protein